MPWAIFFKAFSPSRPANRTLAEEIALAGKCFVPKVRLGHSGLFTTGRAEMWRNAAVFTARAGGKCGLFVHEFAEGRGGLILFFPDGYSSAETRFHFEELSWPSPARDLRE